MVADTSTVALIPTVVIAVLLIVLLAIFFALFQQPVRAVERISTQVDQLIAQSRGHDDEDEQEHPGES
jgi:hypothetical protein